MSALDAIFAVAFVLVLVLKVIDIDERVEALEHRTCADPEAAYEASLALGIIDGLDAEMEVGR